jgi:hypothetical protein
VPEAVAIGCVIGSRGLACPVNDPLVYQPARARDSLGNGWKADRQRKRADPSE